MSQISIPSDVIDDPSISYRATGLYAVLCSMEADGIPLTVKNVSDRSAEGRHALKSALHELQAAGHIILQNVPPPRDKIDPLDWAMVVQRDEATCQYCGKRLWSKAEIHIDHIWPHGRGGNDNPRNLVVACKACNLKKGARTPAEAGMPIREVSDE